MGSNTIVLILFLAAVGAWMWWRTRRMLSSPAARPAVASDAQSAADDDGDVVYDLDQLCQIPAEYAGRADLRQVVLLNDDTTPMDAAALILNNHFNLPFNAVYPAVLDAHEEGECVIAVLPADLAAERIAAARASAEARRYPLQIVVRPLPGAADQQEQFK